MKKIKSNRKMTVLALAVALGAAVYLNWEYARTAQPALPTVPAAAALDEEEGGEAVVLDQLAVPASTEPEQEQTQADKNYGEAQLVSVNESSGDEFFEAARLSRKKSRDEALDTLQKSLKHAKLTEEEKEALTGQLSAQIEHITAENEIESLVRAKGFVDCVAFVDGEQVNITVMTASDGLTGDEVAQIRDIVLSKCSVTARNITVVEVK